MNAGDYSMPQKRRRVFIFAYKNTSRFSQWVKNESLNLNEKNIFNDLFPVEEIKECETIDLNNYEDILDVSNNFNNGKFLESGIMIDGEISHSKIIPISERKYTLSKVLELAKEYNPSLDEFVVEDEKLEKWKYLKGSKRIERTSANGHKYIYSEGSMSFPENIDEPARTMLTSEGTTNRSSHIIYDKDIKKYRILTPVECELIQMFPPNWTDTMPRRNRYFMMGNALVTGIISRLEPKLKEIISNEK
ncbi:DNA cytosine methyltransferase [Peptoniphilus genitalis]